MGRVARYKKVKSSVKNFGKYLTSPDHNDPIKITKTNSRCIEGFYIESESKRKRKFQEARRSKPVNQEKQIIRPYDSRKKQNVSNEFTQKEGESKWKYFERLNSEAAEKIMKTAKKNTNARLKKKKFFSDRKERQKKKRNKTNQEQNRFEDSSNSISTRRVGVHDVVVQPPSFKFKSEKKRFKNMKSIQKFLK